jgi:hypothetical protein
LVVSAIEEYIKGMDEQYGGFEFFGVFGRSHTGTNIGRDNIAPKSLKYIIKTLQNKLLWLDMNNIIMYDDQEVLPHDELNYLRICPAYTWKPYGPMSVVT